MLITKKIRATFQAIVEVIQKVSRYIFDAAARVFGPRDDDYPEIGVQPFEGEPAHKKEF